MEIVDDFEKLNEKMVRNEIRIPIFKKNEDKIKGEFTVVVQGSSAIEGIGEELDRVLRILMGELSLKKAVEIASKITKHSKSKIYDRALKIKNQ